MINSLIRGVLASISGLGISGLGIIASAGASGLFLPDDPTFTGLGKIIYNAECAACHGVDLAGEPDWQQRKPDGKLPAPPHDETGHTWHHADQQLFDITKLGLQHFAGADYQTNMPAYGNKLTDAEIIAVLSYIKSTWPTEIRSRHDAMNNQ